MKTPNKSQNKPIERDSATPNKNASSKNITLNK